MPEQEFTIRDFIWMFLYNTVNDFQAALSEGELLDSMSEIPLFRFMQFWGTYQGFNQDAPVSERLWQRFYYPDTDGYPNKENNTSDAEINYDTNSNKIDYPSADN